MYKSLTENVTFLPLIKRKFQGPFSVGLQNFLHATGAYTHHHSHNNPVRDQKRPFFVRNMLCTRIISWLG